MRAEVFSDGRLVLNGRVMRCALGRGGVSARKIEGDGATPLGVLPLRRVMYRADRVKPPVCRVPLEPIAPNDGWCDDVLSFSYNRPVTLPFEGSHEALWRGDGLYDVIGVLGWNDAPVERAAGSAIFLHVATPDYTPTAGCVALSLPDLLWCLTAGLQELQIH